MKKWIFTLLALFTLGTVVILSNNTVSANTIKTEKGVNKKIAQDLKQAKGWADGSLDEDGNPTDSGSPNPDYAWSVFIYKIKYSGDKESLGDLRIYVTKEFLSLSKKDRSTAIKSAMRYSYDAINDYYEMSYDDMRDGPMTDIFLSQTPIGISKLSNHYKFKWYE